MSGLVQPDPRHEHALCLRVQLLEVLAPDGKCAICGVVFQLELLTIDHVDGCTWDRYAIPSWQRHLKYWTEHEAKVRLRAVCGPCGSRDGATRWQGKPRYVRGERRAA